MGDTNKKTLLDKMNEEDRAPEERTRKRNPVVTITDRSGKDKQISAKVNEKVYATFTQINKAQGISNNSALNMIISRYVRENKGILEDEDII